MRHFSPLILLFASLLITPGTTVAQSARCVDLVDPEALQLQDTINPPISVGFNPSLSGHKEDYWQRVVIRTRDAPSHETLEYPRPGLEIVARLMGSDAPPLTLQSQEVTFLYDKGNYVMAEINFPSAGCWEITGLYQNKTARTYLDIAP